jgi:hypothetical protein
VTRVLFAALAVAGAVVWLADRLLGAVEAWDDDLAAVEWEVAA